MKSSELKRFLSNIEIRQNDIQTKIAQTLEELKELNRTHNRLIETILPLDQEIKRQRNILKTKDYFSKLYTNDIIFDQIENTDLIGNNFTLYSNFLYPSLYIGYNTELLKYLTASEPLYIANWNDSSIKNLLSDYNSLFQRRTRTYLLVDEDFTDLKNLPLRQFSCIVCWDVAKHLSLDRLGLLLNQIIKLLRPGGVLFFNFADCNKIHHLEQAENHLCAYQTSDDIKNLLPANKFQTIEHIVYNNIDYFKVIARGVLSTTKLQPVLGEIIPKTS